jgi:hypothetical protein
MYAGRPTRFSLRRLSDDYEKINDVVLNLRTFEGIIVP